MKNKGGGAHPVRDAEPDYEKRIADLEAREAALNGWMNGGRKAPKQGTGQYGQWITVAARMEIEALDERIAELEARNTELLGELADRSWDTLMSLLDEHWPRDVFPTTHRGEEPERDAGPRIVSLIRWVDEQAKRIAELEVVIAGWKDWHRDLASALGIELIERALTLHGVARLVKADKAHHLPRDNARQGHDSAGEGEG